MPFLFLLAALIVIPVIYGAIKIGTKTNKFQKLGNIKGMPIDDLIAQVGPPTSISSQASGRILYQWMENSGRSGFHYAILADSEGKAVGFTHQFVR